MGRIVAVVNQKGGVGKTTTTVNLAAALAMQGRKVLLVDADAQASASSGLGIAAQPLAKSLYAALLQPRPSKQFIGNLCSKTSLDNLTVLPSGPDLYAAEIELGSEEDRYQRLQRTVQALQGRFDVVLIDCPPSLGMLTLNALSAADGVIVPMQCEYYALEGLTQLTRTLERVRHGLNPRLQLDGVLLTMFDKRNNLARQVAGDVRKHFGKSVFKTVIPRNIRLSEAPGFGQPALVYDPHAPGSRSYVALAREFLASQRTRQSAA